MLQSLKPDEISILDDLLLLEFTEYWHERRCYIASNTPQDLKKWLDDYNKLCRLAGHCHAAFGSKKPCILENQAMYDTRIIETILAAAESEEDDA